MNSKEAIAELTAIYDAAVDRLRTDIAHYAKNREIPPADRRHDGSYAYPELRVHFTYTGFTGDRTRAFGRLHLPGTYATTVTRPQLFADYLIDQLDLLLNDYQVEISVGPSRQEIPFPYVLDAERGAAMLGVTPSELARYFPTTELALIGDEIADCVDLGEPGASMPLSLFD